MEKDPRGAEPTYHTSVTWGRVFGDYIAQKHGGQKSGSCMLHPSVAQAQVARTRTIANARRLMQKPIETDWVHPSATASESAPAATAAPTSGSQTQPPNASAQGTTMQAVCWSDLNAPVIYVSQVFDTQMGRPDQGIDAFSPVSNEFHHYLKGRYDYKTSATVAAHCAGQMSAAQSNAQRSRIMTEFATGKRVVELEWDFARDTSTFARAQDHGYCASSGATGTVYTAGPLDVKGRVSTWEWNRGFSQFLASKYGFQGAAECAVGMPRSRALRHYSFHVQGARAGNKKVVETGWELGTAAPSSAAATPNEQKDREPARPPAAAPLQDVRAFATKEAPEVLAYCQNDRALYRGLDCYKVQRVVYNYRIEHAADGTPEPLTTLLEKLDCSSCVDNVRTPAWAKQQAHGSGNQPAVSECVGQRIMAAFLAKPYVPRLMEAYNATLAACKR
jgi:hypothetical protein